MDKLSNTKSQGVRLFIESFNSVLNNKSLIKMKIYHTIIFPNHFNQNVDNLPSSIKNIKFGNSFNCSIDYLPDSIIHLELGKKFNTLINFFPKILKYLLFNSCYLYKLNNLPDTLLYLEFSAGCREQLTNLPLNLISFKYTQPHQYKTCGYNSDLFPCGIQTITYNLETNLLPCKLKMLTYNSETNTEKLNNYKFNNFSFTKLINLTLHTFFSLLTKYYPSLVKLSLQGDFNKLFNWINFPALTHIIFGNTYNREITNIPNSIKYIYVGYNYNQKIDKIIIYKKLIFIVPNYSYIIKYPKQYKLTKFESLYRINLL